MQESDGQANQGPAVTVLGEGRFIRLLKRGRWEFAERVNATGAAGLVAVTEDDELVLVEQPRPALRGPCIELPAGLIGDTPGQEDEDGAIAAGRELIEETGFEAARIERVAYGPSSPGLSSECLALYLATGLRRVGEGGGVEGEDITVHILKLDEVEAWLQKRAAEGVAIDLKVYAGLHFARTRR